jgi:NAD(P)-dependent dehydrogenase (short-subunit alcohol dehydrogenase family)
VGIGAAATRRLAEAGYRVFAGVHREAGSLAGIPGVQPVAIDVTDPSGTGNTAKVVAEAIGGSGLRAVINNAGVIVQGPLELVPPEELRRQFEVNTLGPAHVIQAFLPLLRTGKGRIINISAPTARVPVPFMAPIGGSKAALASFSDSLRLELAAWGIRVIVIEPGGTDTAIFQKAETAAQAALGAADPAKAALYSDQLAAVAKAEAPLRHGLRRRHIRSAGACPGEPPGAAHQDRLRTGLKLDSDDRTSPHHFRGRIPSMRNPPSRLPAMRTMPYT